ncbi:hypothetical protein LAJ19_10640 [Deinococcus taeanensis]|uniref:hypothetical protein n=1 Tax=Deinococcus taeanensis TaxID=2737050 RepID=UPI001CDBAD5F|nr:hypothetical protein [Deinococcus taeanensis]UBV42089.1 hypothetical protein LAJ19_10640 [Deinococcus taeanensis]
MFGLFRKQPEKPNPHDRNGTDVGEMRLWASATLKEMAGWNDAISDFQMGGELRDMSFTYRGLRVEAPALDNVRGLRLFTRLPECNIQRCQTVPEKAFAYRCLDHVCVACAGVRAYFDPETGELVIAVQSAGFDEQFRADTLIDVALFMLEEGVMHAREYLGLPFTEAPRPSIMQWMGGFHYGEGVRTYASAPDAFAKYMERKVQCQEVSRDDTSILLQSGPLQFEVRFFGWRFGYMVSTATRGFRHACHDDERYVRIQERLAQPIRDPDGRLEWNYRSPGRNTIAYFQPDGTFVLGEYGMGNARTDANGKAFDGVSGAITLDAMYMTYLVEELPEELYSDEQNRPN